MHRNTIEFFAPDPFDTQKKKKKKDKAPSSSLSSFSSCSSSESLGKVYLPAQGRNKKTIEPALIWDVEERFDVQVTDGFVHTHDGATLDTLQVSPPQREAEDKYCIIKFNGNGGFYQDMLNQMVVDALRLNATIVGFNYRNVNQSEKAPLRFSHLEVDGIAQLQRVLHEGIPATHITLDGISLGGAVATCTAAYAHRHNNTVYLFNDRSLSSTTAAAVGIIAPNLVNPVLKSSLSLSVASVNHVGGWARDISPEYNSIPAEFKSHMFIEPIPEESCDGVIAHAASLREGVRPYETEQRINTAHAVLGLFGHNTHRTELRSVANPDQNGQDIADELALRQRRK